MPTTDERLDAIEDWIANFHDKVGPGIDSDL
jgi:hypothetical protein